jgi:hypothetical protein
MTVSEQIIQVLNVLCAKFGLVIDWTSENVIPYVGTLFEKLVKYEIWTSVAWMAFALVALVVITVVFVRARKAEVFDDDFFGPLVALLLIAVFGVFISVVIFQIMDIIKCLTFPEMFVFEYVQKLISSGS